MLLRKNKTKCNNMRQLWRSIVYSGRKRFGDSIFVQENLIPFREKDYDARKL
jgi:hypothetical protein